MSLKQMMDAAEARANAQRKRKLGLSCTQDQEQQEEAGMGWKGSSWEDGVYSSAASPSMPTAQQVPLALRGSATSVLGNLET